MAAEDRSTKELLHEIVHEKDRERRMAIAAALDSWKHANPGDRQIALGIASKVSAVVEAMLKADPELDTALGEVLGKFVCSNSLELRESVIQAGREHGFTVDGSRGLLLALSLGDWETVELLLDIAEWAAMRGADDYAKEALLAAQTAIGRDPYRLRDSMQILLDRLPSAPAIAREWILRFLWCHFDVGYTFLREAVLDLIDKCAAPAPELASGLQDALKKCWPAKTCEEFRSRLSSLGSLQTLPAKASACETIGRPPEDLQHEDLQLAGEMLAPLLSEPGLERTAARVMELLK